MRRSISTVLAAAIAALSLAACGGGSSDPSLGDFKTGFKQDKAQFSRLGSDIGQAITTAAKQTNSELASEFGTLAARAGRQAAKLKQLVPPGKYKYNLNSAIAELGNVANDLKAISTAAKTGNGAVAKTSATRLVRDSLSFQTAERGLSKQLGIPSRTG